MWLSGAGEWCFTADALPIAKSRTMAPGWYIVRQSRLDGAGAPTVDVVFVHGIQGGAFSTWRAERAALSRQPNEGRAVSRQICWPGVWLSADAPKARLLSMKYAAPVTAWQVGLLLSVNQADAAYPGKNSDPDIL